MTERPGPRYARLGREQCVRLHDASLSILERTGVRLLLPEAIELMRRAGATVDGDLVRVPARLVEWALSVAPRSLTLYDRLGRPAIACEGWNVAFGPGSDCLNIVDHRSGERRTATLADVREGVTLCDALPHVDFVMSMFLPSDVDARIADRHQAEIMLSRTTKPLVFVTYETSGLLDALEIAELVAGGADALRARPFLACYINVTRALLHNTDALEKLLLLAGRGLPAIWIPVTSGGTTGPVTMAGNIALNNAAVLVGVVLSQLKREGAPIVIPGFGGDALDLRTMVDPYAEPDHRGMAEALAHHYELPMFSLAGGSDAKLVDQQAAVEASLTLFLDAIAGGHLTHDSGYLDSGLTGSLAQLVICDEIVAWLRPLLAPVVIDDETLALDLIDELGPDGSFLETDHTLDHYRERWYPELIERFSFQGWQMRGGRTLAERAAGRVESILASHVPRPLDPGVVSAVHAVVERTERSVSIAASSPGSDPGPGVEAGGPS
jgi:trimethylamine--corrinoid protein Co-methyltransferase